MPIYSVEGIITESGTIRVIDENTDVLERSLPTVAGAWEISNLANGSKLVVASKPDGNSVAYGGVIPREIPGDSNSTGRDGLLTVNTGDVIVNDYTNATSIGATSVTAVSASAFEAEDEVLIIQTQTLTGNIGNWETHIISSVIDNVLNFDDAVQNTYSVSDTVQLVRIPNYTYVNVAEGARIVCQAWDGTNGGIIFFRAQETVALDGAVYAAQGGFRGGPGRGGNTNVWCWAGESTTPDSYSNTAGVARMALGGGGGGYTGRANFYTPDGGAGGGHAVGGGNGRHNGSPTSPYNLAQGGDSYGVVNLDKIYFGSAGGGGYSGTGGHGGGIIIISAGTINVESTGYISSDGVTAGSQNGSGAGGTVFLQANILNMGTNLVSAGGGNQTTYGGAGGDGRIRLDYNSLAGSTNNPTPGYTDDYISY